jgi:hypothetical protein
MKFLWAVFLCGLAVAGWARLSKENSLQLELLPGQSLRLELSSGDYRIEPGAGNQVVVISQDNARSGSKPHFGIDTSPQEARVKVDGPKNYSAVIQVPKNSNLKVRLNGGRLRVKGVEGNKDIESNAGTVSIDVGKPEKYARVDASVDIGHIEAPPYQVIQDGFGRSFAREGPGMYRLHAHVGNGEIRLYSGGS